MGKEVHITEQHAQEILDELRSLRDDLKEIVHRYERMGTLDYIDGGFGELQDGKDRKEIVRRAGETVLQWVNDLAERAGAMYANRKATFDALWGADWDSKQSIDQTQDQIEQAGH